MATATARRTPKKKATRRAVARATPPRRSPRRLRPFTVEHFRRWSRDLVLDNEERWKLEPFQTDFVRDLFAGRPENWLVLPEGNGKTTLIAGIALYHCEFKPTASVPVAASSRDQAEILYGQAEGLVLRTPRLAKLFKCLPGYRRIICHTNRSRIQIFAADDRTGDGPLPTLAITEELHRHRDLKLYRTWRGKLGKRKGQIIAISTGGEVGSEFEQTRTRIREAAPDVKRRTCFVRAASPQIVLHDYAVPDKADVEDLAVVKSANPFSGITVETLREKRHSPTMTLGHWSRFTCNRATRGDQSAITESEWSAAATDEQIPEGEPIWLGLDVAWKHDTTAMVPLWMRDERFRLLGRATVLTPPRDGNSLKAALVEQALRDIHARNPIHTVVMDPTKAEQLAQWIRDEIGAEVVERSQTDKFAVMDYERFMEGLRTGTLVHSNDRDLTKHAMNAIARLLPGGRTRFDRPSTTRQGGDQERRVIDALTAASMVNTSAVVGVTNDHEIQPWGVAS